MILTDRTMTVNGKTATIDSNVYLYRGDQNVEINFNVVNSKFRFTKKSEDNIIESSEAYYSIFKLIAPTGDEIEFPVRAIENGQAKWLIEKELIDELDEVGLYDFQIRLLNNEKDSIITMPPVIGQIEVLEPLFIDDTALMGVAKTATSRTSILSSPQRETLTPDGNYNRKTWTPKEIIYETDLNTLEDISYLNRESINTHTTQITALQTQVGNIQTSVGEHESKLSEHDTEFIALEERINTKLNSKTNKTDFESLQSDVATHTAQITALQNEVGDTSESAEGSYITVSGSKDGSITDIEILGNTVQDSSNLANIQSVGALREDGLYEMSILSCGKNLFDGELELGAISPSTGLNETNTTMIRSVNFIKIKESTNYYISGSNTSPVAFRFYDKNKKLISAGSSYAIPRTMAAPQNASYVRFVQTSNTDITTNIQIEESSTSTTYEPYQVNKSSILLPCQLEKVGDVSDKLFRREDGVWCVEKNIVTKVLKGGDCSYASSTLTNTIYGRFKLDNMKLMSEVVCDKLVWQTYSASNDTEYCYSWNSDKNNFYINILKSKATDLNSLKTYLNSNPYTVKYITKTPQIIELPLDAQIALNSFNGTTNIFTEDTVIEPTIKATVPKSLGASVQSLVNKTDILSDRIEKVETLQKGNELKVTTDKGYVVVEDTRNGYVEGLKVEGKTLVNLKVRMIWGSNYGKLSELKTNTDYTVIVPINTSTEYGIFDDTVTKPFVNYTQSNTQSIFKINTGVESVLKVYCRNSAGLPTNWKDFIILEGDHTQNPPSYFEGLKSVGDGVDKIEVLSRKEDGNLFNDLLELGSINTSTGLNEGSTDSVRSIGYTRVNKGITIYPYNNLNYSNYIFEYDKNKNLLKSSNILNGTSLTLTNLTEYIRIRSVRVSTQNNLSVIYQVFKGTKVPNVTNHKSNKKQILIQNSDGNYEKPILRKAGDVKDTIEKHSDGKYYYHKRCGEIVLNGSEVYNQSGLNSSLTDFMVFIHKPQVSPYIESANTNVSKLICDKFISLAPVNTSSLSSITKEGVSCNVTYSELRFVISKAKLTTTQDVAGFKTWLQSNPVTVVYQLATEEVYECVNLDLDSYEGETSVIFNGGAISPKITFKIASHIANTIQVLKDRINYLENKVIEMFKAVLSGDVQTLAYELYPEDFENTN